mgnify:CR=1 FL=1
MIWLLFAVFLAVCSVAGISGQMFSAGPWYQNLHKPRWAPPNWLFPVVWATLYVCMAAAGARAAASPGNGLAMALWALQIALNTLWTPVFFGLMNMRAGLKVLAALWLAVAAAMLALWSVDWIAGLLFVPYLAWVSVAGALNLSVIRLNPVEAGRAGPSDAA